MTEGSTHFFLGLFRVGRFDGVGVGGQIPNRDNVRLVHRGSRLRHRSDLKGKKPVIPNGKRAQ